jgi:uncharacterized protein YdaU (DUF1376 family)
MADPEFTPGKSPAFQFYPKDFLTDEHVALMSLHERGAYITLLAKCWIEGSLPSNVELLARLCGTPTPAFRKLWPAIAPCFRVARRGSDRLVNPRLEKERVKQSSFHDGQSERGKRGAAKRWGKHGAAIPTPIAPPSPSNSQPPLAKHASSVFCLQTPVKRGAGVGPDATIQALASELQEIYPEVYATCRAGSTYRTTHATRERDEPNYYALAELYPDARKLRAMLEIFLRGEMGDKNRPGTPGQFRHMAPECEERLLRSGWKATA